ncbi:MAG: hypothetical protein MJY98_09340 [Fibrobacter sp.]|nr:hypothetical protein [Fibrobacter sp.]
MVIFLYIVSIIFKKRFALTASVNEINCPNCGAPVDLNDKECKYCRSPISISTFNGLNNFTTPQLNKYVQAYQTSLAGHPNDPALLKSKAFCLLKLGFYDQAAETFEQVIPLSFSDSEILFYYAVSLLKGKKAFVAMRPIIDKIENSLESAISIEPKGIYYFFWAYVKYDYFFRKKFKTSPTYAEYLMNAEQIGVTDTDIRQLFEILKVEIPQFT